MKRLQKRRTIMRRHYLDNIRWATILVVMIYHVLLIYSAVVPGMGTPFADVQYQDGIIYFLYPWIMILLFIVAGMSSRYYLEGHTIKEFISSRTHKLLVPSTIGVMIFGFLPGYINVYHSGGLEAFKANVPGFVLFLICTASGIGVLWFIQELWLFSMVLAFIRKHETGKIYAFTEKAGIVTAVLLVIPVYLSGLILNVPVIVVYRFGIYPLAFFLGYFVFAHDEVIDRISRWKYVLIPAAVILGSVYLYLHFGDNYADMPVMGSIPAVAYAWAAILAIFSGAKAWADRKGTISAFMTRKSWGIYIFHNMFIVASAILLQEKLSLPPLPCYLVSAVAAFFGSLGLYEIISRIPFLRWCILGIKKR